MAAPTSLPTVKVTMKKAQPPKLRVVSSSNSVPKRRFGQTLTGSKAIVPPHALEGKKQTQSITKAPKTQLDKALSNQQKAYNLSKLGDMRAKRITILVFMLCIFGVVMLFAASAVTSTVNGGSPLSLTLKQILWISFGAVGYFICSKMSLQKVRDLAKPLLLITGILLFVVLLPGISKHAGGASRWIGIGPIDVQPSELAKLAFAIFIADLIAKRQHTKHYFQQLVLPIAFMSTIFGIMIMRQPDLGTTIIVISIALVELGVSRLPKKIFAATVLAAVGAVLFLSLLEPYRVKRLLTFLNPFAHASGSGYQLVQSILALGQGHIFGTGLASSPMAWGLLPNAQTDFIFSVVGNDIGLAGTLSILASFTFLFIMGVKVAVAAEDVFTSHLAIGLVALICGQAFLNIAGVIGILPETGIPLPFFSSGGSSLIVALTACGLLVNISRHHSTVTVPKKSRFSTKKVATKRKSRPRYDRREAYVKEHFGYAYMASADEIFFDPAIEQNPVSTYRSRKDSFDKGRVDTRRTWR